MRESPVCLIGGERLGEGTWSNRCYSSKPYFGGCGNETTGPLGVWSGGR